MDKADDQVQSDAAKELEQVIAVRESAIWNLKDSRFHYRLWIAVCIFFLGLCLWSMNQLGNSIEYWRNIALQTRVRATCAESRLFIVHKDLNDLAKPRIEGETTYVSTALLHPVNAPQPTRSIPGEITLWGQGEPDDPKRVSIYYKGRHPPYGYTEVYVPIDGVRDLLLKSLETIPEECLQLGKNLIEQVDTDEMGWASHYIGRLLAGENVSFRPRGHSMSPRIKSGQFVTVKPAKIEEVEVGDIILCRVQGKEYLHLVDAKTARQVRVANLSGGVNGWTKQIYGKVLRVED